jgi:uncharacterized protein (DUF952 family)
MRIYHVATRADWQAALRSGSYTTSSRGRTLEDEGFIHAARQDQVPGVLARFYSDVAEPLVILEIDTDLLDVPWREEDVGEETYPHVHGPLHVAAVVDVRLVPSAWAAGPDGLPDHRGPATPPRSG